MFGRRLKAHAPACIAGRPAEWPAPAVRREASRRRRRPPREGTCTGLRKANARSGRPPFEGTAWQLLAAERFQVDADLQRMRATTLDDAVHRAHIREIPPPSQDDVLILHDQVIGRVEIHPAELGP